MAVEGFSGAEIESVLLRAMRDAYEEYYRENQEEEHMIGEMNTVDKSSKSEKIKVLKNPTIVPEEHTIKNQHLLSAARNTIPSRDERMLSFMELLAVFESSSKDMLPEKYKVISNDEVTKQLDDLRTLLNYEKRT